MAVLVSIVVGVLMALSYSRKGLFAAAVVFVSIFIAMTAALAFGATVVHVIGYESPYAYAADLLGLALFSFMIVRGALTFIEEEVDFHPVVERLGGAIVGLAAGLLAVGFLCVCVACIPLPPFLEGIRPDTKQATAMILLPCETVRRVMRGDQPFAIDALLSAGGSQYCIYQPAPLPRLTETRSALEAKGSS